MKALESIVVGIDFSEASLAALREAVRLAKPAHGRVVAVEVVEKEVLEEQTRYHKIAAEQAIERIHSNLIRHLAVHGAGSGVEARVIVGRPYDGLVEAAAAVEADLLVLGSRGWDHHPGNVGTVASRCVRRAPLPVLLVRGAHQGGFKRMVACTDFSPIAAMAVSHAAALAKTEGAVLDVIYVDYPIWLQPVHVQYDLQRVPDVDYQVQYRAATKDRLDRHFSAIVPWAPASWQTHVLEDVRAADAICAYLADSGADLVVLGTAGRSGLNALLLGTTAERLIHHSACSVLAVKPPPVD